MSLFNYNGNEKFYSTLSQEVKAIKTLSQKNKTEMACNLMNTERNKMSQRNLCILGQLENFIDDSKIKKQINKYRDLNF